jgi:hypothetical protein
MQVQPYLFFDGRCEEALDFYRGTLGAEVTILMRFKDSPEPPAPGMVPPGSEQGNARELPDRRSHAAGVRRRMSRRAEFSGHFADAYVTEMRTKPIDCLQRLATAVRCRCR